MADTQTDDIYRGDRFEPDTWVFLAEDDAAPSGDAVFVPLERFLAEREALLARNAPTGVLVEAGEDVRQMAGDLPRIEAVAISFPKFSDGRGYSTARILREDLGFEGEIRAVGDVLIDQIALMRRCGIDAFAVSHPPSRADLEAGRIPQVALYYQPVGNEREAPAGTRPWLRRHA